MAWSAIRQGFKSNAQSAAQLIRHGESSLETKLDPVELAAYTSTASVILNLDETITLE